MTESEEKYLAFISCSRDMEPAQERCLASVVRGRACAEEAEEAARERELAVRRSGSTNSRSNLSISSQTRESLRMLVSVTVSLFRSLSFKVVFLFKLSQKEVSSEFSSTAFSLRSPSNLEILSFPFLAEMGSKELKVKLLDSFLFFRSKTSPVLLALKFDINSLPSFTN